MPDFSQPLVRSWLLFEKTLLGRHFESYDCQMGHGKVESSFPGDVHLLSSLPWRRRIGIVNLVSCCHVSFVVWLCVWHCLLDLWEVSCAFIKSTWQMTHDQYRAEITLNNCTWTSHISSPQIRQIQGRALVYTKSDLISLVSQWTLAQSQKLLCTISPCSTWQYWLYSLVEMKLF